MHFFNIINNVLKVKGMLKKYKLILQTKNKKNKILVIMHEFKYSNNEL